MVPHAECGTLFHEQAVKFRRSRLRVLEVGLGRAAAFDGEKIDPRPAPQVLRSLQTITQAPEAKPTDTKNAVGIRSYGQNRPLGRDT